MQEYNNNSKENTLFNLIVKFGLIKLIPDNDCADREFILNKLFNEYDFNNPKHLREIYQLYAHTSPLIRNILDTLDSFITWQHHGLLINPSNGWLKLNTGFMSLHLCRGEVVGFVVNDPESNQNVIRAVEQLKSVADESDPIERYLFDGMQKVNKYYKVDEIDKQAEIYSKKRNRNDETDSIILEFAEKESKQEEIKFTSSGRLVKKREFYKC